MKSPTGDLKKTPLGRRLLWGAGAGLAAGALAAILASVLPRFEDATLDLRQRALSQRGPAVDRAALVLIDDDSIESLTAQDPELRWPWPRELQAAMVRFLKSAGAKAIVFDLLFIDDSRVGADDDRAFAEAIRDAGNVWLAAKLDVGVPGEAAAPPPGAVEVPGWSHPALPGRERLILPLDDLAKEAAGIAVLNVRQDDDNTIRRAELLFPHGGKLFPSLGLAAARAVLGPGAASADGRSLSLDGPDGASRRIPLGPDGRLLIRWYGGEHTFAVHHAADLVRSFGNMEEGKAPVIDPGLFKDRVVFIAPGMAGMEDIITAPTSIRMPGVEYHATTFGNIAGGDFLRTPAPAVRAAIAVFLALLAALAAFAAWRPGRVALVAVVIAGAWAVAAILVFRTGLVLDIFYPVLGVALTGGGALLAGYLGEGRQKREIASAFGQYLSPIVIRDVMKKPEGLKLGGEEREITVFFSDIQGFSTFSEKMTSEELVSFLNVYLTAMTDVILEHRGVVDKYIGDAIMAFWGAPELLPIDALQACLATLEQKKALEKLNVRFRAEGRPEIKFRAGLNRGPATVGNMGSSQRFSYTAMSDTVNLASRLEGANKFFGTYYMISETVRAKAGEGIVTRPLGKVKVVGKAIAVPVHELVGRRGEVDDARMRRIALYDEGLRLLEAADFRAAAERFEAYLAGGAEKGAERCLALARERATAGGPAWDGVWELTSK
jgi:adenylate cyclase